jgi:23S rRNA pseudouridine1911/1915/1917 synthase
MSQEESIQEGFLFREIKVDPGQTPLRIDRFLVNRMEKVTRNKIQQAIKAGAVTVDEQKVKPNYKIRPNQHIKIVLPELPDIPSEVIPEDIPLDIVYEDEHLLVINKQAGMVVHPGIANYSGTLVNALAHYLKTSKGPLLPGNSGERPGLVHRIDKDTSGLLVIGKDDFCLSTLAKQFFERTIDRHYLALVWGAPDPVAGTIDEYIARDPKNRLRMQVFRDRDYGKQAITHYETLEDLYYVSLVRCKLETGKTHQIRIHMKYKGNPVFNDPRYDGNRIHKGTVFSKYKQFVDNCFDLMKGQALHAASLGFTHPYSGERLYFEVDVPANFQQVMEKWRTYVSDRRSKQQ